MQPIPTSFGSIRAYRDSDAAALAHHANNPRIAMWLRDGFPHPYTDADAATFLSRAAAKDPVTLCAIATPDELIGGLGIMLGEDVHRKTAEIGYWLAEPYWGRGFMSEAVRLFVDDSFRRFDLVRIHADPYADNRASARVLEKAGFSLEARLRASVIKGGVIMDQEIYAIVRLPSG
jgi:[ribosomal protein S5]-alanine N-acetyltransferase